MGETTGPTRSSREWGLFIPMTQRPSIVSLPSLQSATTWILLVCLGIVTLFHHLSTQDHVVIYRTIRIVEETPHPCEDRKTEVLIHLRRLWTAALKKESR